MLRIERPLFDPAPQHLDLAGTGPQGRLGGRHDLGFVVGRQPCKQFACARLFGHDGPLAAGQLSGRAGWLVQTKFRLPLLIVRAVALKAVSGQNRPHVAGEINCQPSLRGRALGRRDDAQTDNQEEGGEHNSISRQDAGQETKVRIRSPNRSRKRREVPQPIHPTQISHPQLGMLRTFLIPQNETFKITDEGLFALAVYSSFNGNSAFSIRAFRRLDGRPFIVTFVGGQAAGEWSRTEQPSNCRRRQGGRIIDGLWHEKTATRVPRYRVTTRDEKNREITFGAWARQSIPFVNAMIRVGHGRRPFAPTMQMNTYNLNKRIPALAG